MSEHGQREARALTGALVLIVAVPSVLASVWPAFAFWLDVAGRVLLAVAVVAGVVGVVAVVREMWG